MIRLAELTWPRTARLAPVVLVVLAATACVTLTPAQEKSAAEIRALADQTFKIYKVPSIPIVIGAHVTGTGGTYAGGMFTVGSGMLASPTRDVVVAHELAHYLLGHDGTRLNVPTMDRRVLYEQWELDANAKGVEILSRVKPMPEELALSLFYQHGIGSHRGGGIPFGHKPACEEIADLLSRFPQHATWTATLECAKTAPGSRPALQTQPPSREGSRSERVVWGYLASRSPSNGATLEKPEALPRRVVEFDRSGFWVVLFLAFAASDSPGSVTVRWSHEDGLERTPPEVTFAGVAPGSAWRTHAVNMSQLRPYPGRWTARVSVGAEVVGEYAFRLLP